MQETLFSNSNRSSSQTVRRLTTKTAKTALALTLAISSIGITAAPAANAAPHSNKTTDAPANVIAHVEVAGGPVTRMLLLKKNGKEYLVLGLDSAARAVAVDVSEPSQPRTLEAAAGTVGAPATEMNVVADTLTIFGGSDAESAASASPKEIRSLPGVTAFLKDKAHGLIYATNGAGLWIVKTKRQTDDEGQFYGYSN